MIKTEGTFVIDLLQSEENIFKGISKKKRKFIQQCKRRLRPVTYNGLLQVFSVKNKDYQFMSMIGLRIKDEQTVVVNSMCIDKSQKNNNAYTYLLWKAMLWAKKEGYERFDMGGVDTRPTQHQKIVNHFKERFGGQYEEKEREVSFLNWLAWKYKRFLKTK